MACNRDIFTLPYKLRIRKFCDPENIDLDILIDLNIFESPEIRESGFWSVISLSLSVGMNVHIR
jgi:hypothetical protein